jgi:tRNA A37 N6-isopentenylltransferase MiaA
MGYEDHLTLDKYQQAVVDFAKKHNNISLDDAVVLLWNIDQDGYWLRPRVRRLIDNMKRRGLLQQVKGNFKLYEIVRKSQGDSKTPEGDRRDNSSTNQATEDTVA